MSRRRRDRRRFFRALGPVAPRPEIARVEVEQVTLWPSMTVELRPVKAPNLEALTVVQLRALAIERGVVLGAARTKVAIIAALR